MARVDATWKRSYADGVLDAVSQAVLVVDARQEHAPLLMSNAAARRRLDFHDDTGQMLGAPLHRYLGGQAAAAVDAALTVACNTAGPCVRVIRWRMRRGELPLYTEFSRLHSDSGQCAVLITIMTTAAPEAPPPKAIEKLPIDLLILDRNLRITFVNPAAVTSSGSVAAHLIGRSALSVVPTAAIHIDAFRGALEGTPFHHREVAVVMPSGERRRFDVFVQPLMGGAQVMGLIVLSSDVTDRCVEEGAAKTGRWEFLFQGSTLTWTDEIYRIYETTADEFPVSIESALARCSKESRRRFWNAATQAESGSGQFDVELEITTLADRCILARAAGCIEFLDGRAFRAFGSLQPLESTPAPLESRADELLRVTTADRRRLEREILEISSRERQSIGRDLHDGLGQELTGVTLMLRALSTRIQSACPAMSDNVEEIIGVVNQSIESVRSLARGLMPASLDRDGLTPALRALAARGRTLYGLDVLFHVQGSPELLMDEASASHLYRIAQEALTNAARHGHATAVQILLSSTATDFLLRISDNGCGMTAAAHASKGMGLKIMAYRAGMIDATLEVVKNEPRGTIVQITGQHPRASHSGMMSCDI
jgi:PAS domain S-box-containing protein